MVMEIWKDIKGYESLYQVSNLGRVKRLKKQYTLYNGLTKRNNIRTLEEKILKGTINKGYRRVVFTKNYEEKSFFVHRLVVENFIRPLQDNETIDHIDCDKLNNRLENLDIVSIEENNYRAFKNGLRKNTRIAIQPVYLIDDYGNTIKEYTSMNKAAKDLGISSSSHIGRMLRGKQSNVNGYKFKAKPVSTRNLIVS